MLFKCIFFCCSCNGCMWLVHINNISHRLSMTSWSKFTLPELTSIFIQCLDRERIEPVRKLRKFHGRITALTAGNLRAGNAGAKCKVDAADRKCSLKHHGFAICFFTWSGIPNILVILLYLICCINTFCSPYSKLENFRCERTVITVENRHTKTKRIEWNGTKSTNQCFFTLAQPVFDVFFC